MPTGAGTAAGPFHSQSNEAWFFHTPGLKIVYPSNPYDAKGLLCAAIDDPNPYLYFEHKLMYRSIKSQVPDEYYQVEIGKAKLVREGNQLSIITYGMGVHWAQEILDTLPGVQADVLDLRTLLPWDQEAVIATVKKTSRVLILHEDTLNGGIGGEISAWISEHLFEHLDAPVLRVASLDTPIPFAPTLENNFLPKGRLRAAIEKLTEKEVLAISPVEADALLFERSFLSYDDRIHHLRVGYVAVMTLARDRWGDLSAQFARHGLVMSRARFEDRAGRRLARLDEVARVADPNTCQPMVGPARIGGIGAAWRKAK